MPLPVFAVTKLYDDVVTSFASDPPLVETTPEPVSLPVDFMFGWRAPEIQKVRSAIVFVPGDPAGTLGPILQRTGFQQLRDLDELVTIWVSGADQSDPENERKQYIYTRFLFDELVRALVKKGRNNVRYVSQTWDLSKKVRRHGAAIRLLVAVMAPIPDREPTVIAGGAARARINLEELDHSEEFTVPPE